MSNLKTNYDVALAILEKLGGGGGGSVTAADIATRNFNISEVSGNITEIRPYAFEGISSLRNINLPDVRYIGEWAFSNLNLENVYIGNGNDVNVSFYPFGNTTIKNLYLDIPSIIDLDYTIFANDSQIYVKSSLLSEYKNRYPYLSNIIFPIDSPEPSDLTFDPETGRLYGDVTTLDLSSIYNSGIDKSQIISVDLPNVVDVTYYDDDSSTFKGCSNLTSINMPSLVNAPKSMFRETAITSITLESLQNISDSCFRGCADLEYVYMPSAIDVADYAFRDCKKLNTVNLPNVISLANPFSSAVIDKLILPKAESLGRTLNMSKLNDIYLGYNGVVSTSTTRDPSVFVFLIHIPADLLEAYQNDGAWGKYYKQTIGDETIYYNRIIGDYTE